MIYTATSFTTRYTFSAKEKDEETGYSYFGARYYNSTLSVWLSVDPMADKYPNTSPYVYCADNPVKLVDPDGKEVEYNSFADRLLIGITRIFNSEFRTMFKELKESEDTYVFNKNNEGNNFLSTDGDKLFINYSMTDNAKSNGQTIFSLIMHETTHACQFEHGEIGFECDNGKWNPMDYDIYDELEAQQASSRGFFWNTASDRFQWGKLSVDKQIESLEKTPAYSGIPEGPCDSPFENKIKYDKYFIKPYKP